MTIIYFILILGTTVFIHEFGHFMFAKKFGVHVYEFSIGMGPKLFKFNLKNDETDYCIRLLPLGGFVQMAGEEINSDEEIPVENRLYSKPIYQRFLIMVAGVTMNFILAIVILFFIGLFNTVSLNNVYVSDSSINNLNDGDKIVAINGNFVNNYDKLALELTVIKDKNFTMTVKDKNSKKRNIKITPNEVGSDNLLLGYDYGFEVSGLTITFSEVENIQKNDEIVEFNNIKINNYTELLNNLRLNKNKQFTLTVKDKNGNLKESTIKAKINSEEELYGYNYGFYITGKTEKGFFAAIKYAILKFFSSIEQMVFTVIYLITGKISLGMLSGPVGIFNVVSVYSKTGFSNILSLLSLICINVGFINLLPLPAFDGGHILFLIIEKIKGSKVNPKVENTIHTIGFILLMILMILVTYNDIIKLF